MTCYAIGRLRNVEMGAEIVAYLEAIDATLAPFEGHFIIHGGKKHMLEGTFVGDLIVIVFPDNAKAQAWYTSSAYQHIKALRTKNAEGEVFLIDGVDADHRAADILSS
ncbi:DUF1330 domain-containing protein [Paracoccus albus]|uniref:DUF1330 domain-containing protein n=1 Tax=Paracoccus albus TaxID=3017784 RepID=UPI0022F0E134|nr:DUF1330 domain-containing protein [Paracoccus albus]WBU60981.1 DUF1330 domain-containing protein [Paracoccus albus]